MTASQPEPQDDPDGTVPMPRTAGDLRSALERAFGTIPDLLSDALERGAALDDLQRIADVLIARQDHMRRLIEASGDALVTIDETGTVTAWSGGAADLFGWTAERALGRSLHDFLIPARFQYRHLQGLKRFLDTGESTILDRWIEVSAACADGSERTVELRVRPARLAQGWAFDAVVRDITRLRAVEQDWARTDADHRRFLALAREGIWRIDESGRTVFANDRMAAMLGCDIDDLLGASMYDFMDAEGRIIAEGNVERRRAGIAEEHDFRFVRADGSVLWATMSTSPLTGDDGTYLGSVALVSDVTEARKHEREQARRRDQAEALARLSRSLSSLLDVELDLVLDSVVREVGALTGDFATISLLDDDNELAWIRAMYHSSTGTADALRGFSERPIAVGEGAAGQVLADGRPLVVPDVDARAFRMLVGPDASALVDELGLQSGALLPLGVRGRTIGVLGVGRSDARDPFTDDDIAFLMDVAERTALGIDNARLYRALSASEERFRIAQLLAPTGVAQVDIDGRWLDANPAACAILGRTRDELLGLTFQDVTHPDDLDDDLAQVERILTGDASAYQLEKRYVRPDGTSVWVFLAVSLVRDERGDPLYFIAQIADISARRNAELLTNSVFDTSPDLMCVVDSRGVFLKVSPSWTDQLGWSADELLTRDVLSIVHPDDRPATIDALKQVASGTRAELRIEIRCATRTGDHRWLQWNSATVAELGVIVAIGRDVTDQKRQAEELARSNADLEHFALIAAHDLKSPLGIIAGYAELLGLEPAIRDNELALESAEQITVAAARLSRLVDDLLVFARVGSASANLEHVDLRTVAYEVTELLSSQIAARRAIVDVDDLPTVIGDNGLLRQLLLNLIGNAVKFVPRDRTPHVWVTATTAADGWTVDVADNGIGIDPDQHDRVFEMFQRVQPSGPYEGTGIGLAICQRIVEHHHGTIWIEQNEPVGTRVRVRIPKPCVSDRQ